MAKDSEINRIEVQKRLLVARSQIHRQTLELEIQQVKESTAWIGKTSRILKAALPFLAVGAPIAGYFIAKKKKKVDSLPQKALWFWEAFKHVKSFWDGFRSSRQESSFAEKEPFSEHFRPG